ncbi:UNVERIFIED_CONTAM: Protein AGENET DOMAIN (AGD)-CONTAINING P1 [Sesamum indicum]
MGGAAKHLQPLKPRSPQTSSPHHPHNRRRSSRHHHHHHFPQGSLVEVRTDEEDFKGVFFSATVLPPPKKGSKKKSEKLYVEYIDLLADEDGSDRLREYVDISFVRPPPPLQEIVKGFEPDDVVDAFYKDGWWTGVVSRVVEGGQRFVVTFQYPPDELEFGLAELRVHWDWVNGSWVRPGKQNIAGSMFDVGRTVEVSFDREDRRDAWFPATIQEDLGKGAFVVEYCSEDTDNKVEALKVTIDSPHLRPCPPLLKEKNFDLLEKVDAFFNFGWWSGVITKELENSRYVVFFKQMKRDKEFYQSELRPHMEWKDGKWFTSSQSMGYMELRDFAVTGFSVMMECMDTHPCKFQCHCGHCPVNYSGDRKDSCDRKSPSSSTLRKGQLEQLTSDDKKMSHMTASVIKRRQNLSDSWGALSQPLKKLEEGNVLGSSQQVTHDRSTEEMCVSVSPVSINYKASSARQTATGDCSSDQPSWGRRLGKPSRHLSWCLHFKFNPPNHRMGFILARFGTQRECCRLCLLARRKQRNIDATEKFGEVVNLTSSYDYEPKLQLESLELNIEGKEPDALGNTTPVQNEQVKEEGERPVIIGLPCTEMGSSEFGRKGKRGSRSSSKLIMNPGNGQMQQLNDSTILKMKLTQTMRFWVFSLGKNKQFVYDSKFSDPLSPRRALWLDGILAPWLTDSRQLEVVEFSERRKRGRPRKLQIESIRTSVAENGVVGSDDVYRKDDEPHRVLEVEVMEVTLRNQEKTVFNNDKLTNGRSGPKSKEGSVMKRTFAKMHNEKVVKDSITVQENSSFKRGRRRVRGEKIALQVQDSLDSSGRKMMEVNCTVEVNKVICDAPSNELDDEPLSKWIEGMHSSSFIDGSRPSPVSTMEECIGNGEKQRDNIVLEEDGGKQPENGKGASVSVDEGSIVPCEQQSLPFVKNTVLWKTIESMEVFQRIPQRPHFQPLENFRESSREGLAIGYMVTFSSVVEKTSRLQVNDPKSITDDILETLADLERQGFDVRAVRERVAELLSVKDKQERLVDEVDKLNNQILEHNREKSRIDEEIREINEHIGKLQQKLSLAESAKEKEDDEIASLLARLKETEESINKVGRDFEGIAASRL